MMRNKLAAMSFACGCAMMATGCSQEAEEGSNKDSSSATKQIEGPDLAALLDFKDPVTCEWSEAAASLFDQATVFRNNVAIPGRVTVPGIPDEKMSRIERPDPENPYVVDMFLDFKGEWLGLQVTGISDSFIEQSGVLFGRSIRFDAPKEQVLAALSRAGFKVSSDGSQISYSSANPGEPFVDDPSREVSEEFVTTYLSEEEGETEFTCHVFYDGI